MGLQRVREIGFQLIDAFLIVHSRVYFGWIVVDLFLIRARKGRSWWQGGDLVLGFEVVFLVA